MQRNRAIDCIKGVAILLVMLGHCIVLNGLNTTDPYLYDAIKSIQMPLFMAVSGVLAGISFSNKQRTCFDGIDLLDRNQLQNVRQKSLKQFWQMLDKRAFSYLTPFFSWFVIAYLIRNAVEGTLSFAGFGAEFIGLLMQTDRGLWFLMTLFIVTIVIGLTQYVADFYAGWFANMTKMHTVTFFVRLVRLLVFLVDTFFVYFLFFLQGRSQFTFLSPSLTVQYMPFYVLGYLAFGYGKPFWQQLTRKLQAVILSFVKIAALLSLILFVFLVVRFDLTLPADSMMNLLLQMSASLFGTYAVFVLIYWFVNMTQQRNVTVGVFSSFVGQYTLEIYVLHFRFARLLGISQKGLSFYSFEGIAWTIAAFLVMAFCTAVCVYFFKKVRWTNLILFGK